MAAKGCGLLRLRKIENSFETADQNSNFGRNGHWVTNLSLTGVTAFCPCARHINPSLVLVQRRKTRPYITEMVESMS